MTKTVRNFYEMVPQRTRPGEDAPDGTVQVLLPRFGDGRFGRFLAGIFNKKPVRVRLDDIGTGVWRLCDGERSVDNIGKIMAKQFGDRIEPVYDRLQTFLEQMRRAGIIEWKN